MKPVEAIWTIELFPPLSSELLTVLKSLQPTEWAYPTACSPWTVKDVVAHLLGGNFGRLWKDSETSTASLYPDRDYNGLVALINANNELWVQAARRISPEILLELLDLTDRRLYAHFRNLAPYQPAKVAVAWAGDIQSPNWFDIAREYTEKWLHQQHIREAVGQPILQARKWLFPVLDTFLRGLPHTYRLLEAPDGTSVSLHITGEAGGQWTLRRENGFWRLFAGADSRAVCCVQLSQDLAWRLFTKGVTREDAHYQAHIEGDPTFGSQILHMISIMA